MPAVPILPSLRSRAGLNATNFFLAEVTGVVMPFLNDLLHGRGWRYDAIGLATAAAGLGVFVMQTPAGFLVDRVRGRRALLAAVSVVLGVSYGLVPLLPAWAVLLDPLLVLAGACQAFFAPLLGALALGLVGHARLCGAMGHNQAWNHLGNLAAALSAMGLVAWLGLPSVFYAVAVVSVLAASSVFLIRADELDETRATGATEDGAGGGSGPAGERVRPLGLREILRDRRVVVLIAATALFHLANAPVMPLVALYVKHLHGSDRQVAAVVLVAQAVMVPVAFLSGWLCERWGRKPLFAIGFVVLPLRIFLYSLTSDPRVLIALQALDGIGAGIYGVVIVALCADLTRGKDQFNALAGIIATALSLGGVVGPLLSGFLVQHLGFRAAFYLFAGIAVAGAALFLLRMPETGEPWSGPPNKQSRR